jgi:two-component system, NarL family, response regulator NreC
MLIKVLITEDHKIVREGICSLLSKEADIKVVAEAEDGMTAVQLAKELSPDVVVMDIGLPNLNGIEATRQIVASVPGVKVIALSMHSDRRYILEMLKAGAKAYLLKDCAFEEMVQAVRSVIRNKVYLSQKITETMINDQILLTKDESSVFTLLSDRERQVLQLIAEGMTMKEIAHSLKVSLKTAETYRQRIIEKLNIHSVAELTKYAIREGLIQLES